jgi:cytochrome c-type biogenesis protein CcmH
VITFLSIGILISLVAVAFVAMPLLRGDGGNGRAPVAALFATLAMLVTVVLAYPGVSNYPWSALHEGKVPSASAREPTQLDLDGLRSRLAADPDDLPGWVTLGNGYLAQERFAEARDAYRKAMDLGDGSDDGVRLAFAEAAILADRAAMAGEAGRVIDEVLERNPSDPKALWYGGMVAIGRGDVSAARVRWTRLLELSPPPQVRQIIEEQLAAIDSGASTTVGATSPEAISAKIPVRIRIAPALATRIRGGAALFLIARSPGAAGPPLAVVRRQPAELPVSIEIGDSDAMIPGRSIVELEEIELTARIANGAEAIAAPGDLFGSALWQQSSVADSPIEIVIDKVVD